MFNMLVETAHHDVIFQLFGKVRIPTFSPTPNEGLSMLIKVQHAAVNLCCDVEGQQVWRTFTLMSGMTCGVAAGSCTDRTEPASPSTCSGLISSLQQSSLFLHTHVLSPCLRSAFIPTFCPCSCSWFQLVANMTTNSGDQQSA